jgi:hemoglobin-like flavoprotein
MTPDQITLVRSTFASLQRVRLDPGRVYDRLFELHPGLRSRFPDPLGALPQNFWSGLTGLVARLDDVAGLTEEASRAAAHHRNMGVSSEEFEALGATLGDVVASTLGAEYTAAHAEALRRTWQLVTEVLQQRPRAHRDAVGPV